MHNTLLFMFPDYTPGDWVLQDDGDDKGVYIAQWNRTEPKPTSEDLAAASAQLSAEALPKLKAGLTAKIDDHMGTIFMRFQRFTEEYKNREASARAFIAGTDAEGADVSIVNFATAKGLTYAQACAVVVSQADGLRGAIGPLGALRMRKYEIDHTADEATAKQIHDDIVAQANKIAAKL